VTPPPLATARLALTPLAGHDVDALWHIWNEPDVRRYLFDDVEVTRERTAGIVDACLAHARAGLGLWVAREAGRDPIVGVVGLRPVEGPAQVVAGLAGMVETIASFTTAVWHRGYATEALGAVVDHAFTSLGLQHLAAVVDEPNAASHRLVQRLGFRPVGEGDGPRYRFRAYALRSPRS
jgi:RimJ/RimL family protein N-acetyltransferase